MARFLRTYGIAGIRAPAVVGNGIYFAPIQTVTEVARRSSNSLIRTTKRATVYHLRPPATLEQGGFAFTGPAVALAQPASARNPRRATYYRLGPPAVTTQPQGFIAAPIAIHLAPNTTTRVRRTVESRLKPGIVGPGVTYGGPRVYLTQPVDRIKRRGAHYRLAQPAAVVSGTAVYTGPFVKLSHSPRRRATYSVLRQVLGAPVVFAPIAGYLTPPRSRTAPVHYRLAPPATLEPPASTDVFAGAWTWIVPNPRPSATYSRLAPPAVVTAVVYYGPKVYLTELTWRRRRRRTQAQGPLPVPSAFQPVGRVAVHLTYSRRGIPKSILRKPVVIDLTPQVYYLSVTLARIKHPPVQHVLRPPTDLVDQQDVGKVAIHLTCSRRGVAKSRLWPVPAAFQPVGFVRVHLTYSLRGKPKSILRPPTVIDLRPQVYSITTWLTYSRRGTPKSRLAPPTVVTAASTEVYYGPQVTLVRRPTPKAIWHLGAPQNIQALVFAPIQGYLTLPRSTRPKTVWALRPPTTVVVTDVFYGPAVTLTYSRRAKPKSILRAPIIPPLARPIETTLVRIRPVTTRYELRAPTVIDLSPQAYYLSVTLARNKVPPTMAVLRPPTDLIDQADVGRTKVELAPPHRLSRKTVWRLRPPTVIDNRPQVNTVAVNLTYSRRGKATYDLAGPIVIFAPDEFFLQGPGVWLAYSRRGVPKSKLRAAAVVAPVLARPIAISLAPQSRGAPIYFLRRPTDLVDEADKGRVAIHLTYSRRGRPKSFLRPPTVIDLRPQVYTVGVNLTYSRRGKPFYFLRPDSKFAPVPQADYTLLVHLTYQSRGKPKSKLRPPTVIDTRPQVYYLSTWLARNKVRPTRYRLRPPTVVRIFARPTAIHLTYSRRGKPKSRLFGIVYGAKVYAPISTTLAPQRRGKPTYFLGAPTDVIDAADLGFVRVHLAYSRRGKPKSFLKPPTVVIRFQAAPISITLAPQKRGRPVYQLSPPTVIDLSSQVYRIATTFVRIRPVPTRYFTIAVPVEPTCYGNVVGFDFGPEVCGDDEGATVIGSMTGHQVHGSESSATVTGASAASGSVSGGDEKTEGC